MSIPVLDACALALTGGNVFSEVGVYTNDADVILGFMRRTLLAAGWTQTNVLPPTSYWIASISSFPTQNPGTLVPFPYPPSAIAATFVVAGVTQTIYFFDPTKYNPATPPAGVTLATVGSTQTITAQNYAAAVGTATGTTGSYFLDGAGNIIVIASDTSGLTLSNSNVISGNGFGTSVSWGYHGTFPADNTHFINGGWELQSGAANGITQYKVQILRGGPVYTPIVAALGVTDYSGGFSSSSIYAVFPNGDRKSYGQFEYNIAAIKIIDQYGGHVTYELSSGVSSPSATSFPQYSKVKMSANRYQFMTWADGWAIGGPPVGMFVSAPQTDLGLYFVIASSTLMFEASEYPASHPFPHQQGDNPREKPSWTKHMSAALNGSFRAFAPDGGASGALYQGVGLVGLAMGNGYPVYSPNGLPILGTPYLVAPPDPSSTTQDSVLVGRMWDAAYISEAYGTLDGPSAPNEPSGAFTPDPTYERTARYLGYDWRLFETSVLNVGTLPWQSLWMKVDTTV